jgi:hypothetical protein
MTPPWKRAAVRHAIPLGYAFTGLTLMLFGAAGGGLWPMAIGGLCCWMPSLVDGVK